MYRKKIIALLKEPIVGDTVLRDEQVQESQERYNTHTHLNTRDGVSAHS